MAHTIRDPALRAALSKRRDDWGFVAWPLFGFAAFLSETSGGPLPHPAAWALLLALGFVMQHLAIAVHEAGHWLAGLLVGVRCPTVRIGGGRCWLRLRIAGTELQWRLWPRGGAVFPENFRQSHTWRGGMLFIAAGALAEAALLTVLLCRWSKWGEWQPTWAMAIERYLVISGSLSLFVDIVHNLTPGIVETENGRTMNDGASLRDLWRSRDSWDDDCRYFRSVAAYNAESTALSPEQRKAWLSAIVREHPRRVAIRVALADACLALGQIEETRTKIGDVLSDRELSTEEKIARADHFATAILIRGERALFADAERWLREACGNQAPSVTLRGTLGSLAAELGKDEAARVELVAVLALTESAVDRAFSESYLAWLDAKAGNHAEAAERLKRAKAHGPELPVVARIERSCAELRGDALTAPENGAKD